jgi:hypothetical protein
MQPPPPRETKLVVARVCPSAIEVSPGPTSDKRHPQRLEKRQKQLDLGFMSLLDGDAPDVLKKEPRRYLELAFLSLKSGGSQAI